MAKKKLTRKELLKEPDEFITTTGRLISLGVAYRRQLTIGTGIIFALLVLFAITRFMSVRADNRSFTVLNQVMAKYEAGRTGKSGEERLNFVKADFNDFLNQYGKKAAGRIGRVIFAGICHEGGDLDAAASLYRQALEDFEADPFYRNMVRASLGQVYAAKNDTAQSSAQFEAAVSKTASPLADTALFGLALQAEAQGQKDQALSYFKRISEEFPDSMFKEIVRERITG